MVNGLKQSSFILHKDLTIMAYTSRYGKYYNSEEFIVKSFNDKHIALVGETSGSGEFIIEFKETKKLKTGICYYMP